MTAWVARAVIESALLVVLALAFERTLLRRSAAALRHGPWLLVFARLLVPPLAVAAPEWSRPIAAPAHTAAAWIENDWSFVLFAIWASVAFVLLLRLGVRARNVRRVLLASSRPASAELRAEARRIARAANLRGAIRVRVHDGAAPALLVGLRRPVILLAARLDGRAREAALWHECLHIARRDPWMQAALEVVHALWWFHPLLPLAKARAASARELACDRAVVHAWRGGAGGYRRVLLVEAARRLGVIEPEPTPLGATTLTWLRSPALIRERLEALERGASRSRMLLARSFVALCAAFALLTACGEARPLVPVTSGWWNDADLARAEVEARLERRPGEGCAPGRLVFMRALALEAERNSHENP